MTEQEINAMVTASMPSIKVRLQRELEDSLYQTAKQQLHSKVADAVTNIVTEVFVPELKEVLLGEKAKIRKIADDTSVSIATAIKEALVKSLTAKLEQSLNRKKLMEALFD